jgi:hypothetical protein
LAAGAREGCILAHRSVLDHLNLPLAKSISSCRTEWCKPRISNDGAALSIEIRITAFCAEQTGLETALDHLQRHVGEGAGAFMPARSIAAAGPSLCCAITFPS